MAHFKNVRFNILIVVILCLVLSILLSACGIFNSMNKISSISIEIVDNSIVDSNGDGIYEVEAGKDILLNCKWEPERIVSPSFKWTIIKDSLTEDITTRDFKYTLTKVGSTCSISLKVNEVVCPTEIKVICVEPTLDTPTIISPSHTVVQGIIQQNINDVIRNVDLIATWNDKYIDVPVEVVWYVDDVKQEGETNSSYSYDVSAITGERNVTIKCEINKEGSLEKKTSSIILSFINKFLVVSSVNLSLNKDKLVQGTTSTYYVEASSVNPGSISISAVANPLFGTNMSSKCVWKKQDINGERILEDDERDVVIPLTYGKNVIYATIDNVESKKIIVFSLDSTTYKTKKNVITDTFIWEGNEQDHYINSQDDLNALIGYVVGSHSFASHTINVAVPQWQTDKNAFKAAVNKASTTGVDESGSFGFTYSTDSIGLSSESFLGEPSGKCPSMYTTTQQKVVVSYEELSSKRTLLPIDSAEETMNVSNSNQLYRAVSWGYRPIFGTDEKGVALQSLYNKAREVLINYISDDMSDLEKVRIIYEWIINEVAYDQATLNSKSTSKISYNAFYLEGVFNDKCAVCDGKSKAFSLLCGMEGITSLRIMGFANENLSHYTTEQITSSEFGHAWNKVLIDANDDGVKEWYFVDTTWGDISSSTSAVNITEWLSYEYFLRTDAQVQYTHYSESKQPAATTKYDYYKSEKFTYLGEEYDLYIESNAEYKAFVLYAYSHREDENNILLARVVCDVTSTVGVMYSYKKIGEVYYILF